MTPTDRNSLTEPLVERCDQKLLFSDGHINRVVYNNEVCRLELSASHLICTEESSKKITCRVKVSEIIGCREAVETKETAHSFPHRRFLVFCYPLHQKRSCLGASIRRQRLELSFTAVDTNACTNLVNVIRTFAWGLPLPSPTLTPSLSEEHNSSYPPPSPRRFLVFINPVGGTGRAMQIWKRESEPLFLEAGVQFEVVVTQRADHAKDECASRDLSEVDGIVIVGGDGLIFEVVSGLSSREPDSGREVFARVPLLPIPGGSGNGLAKSILHQCGEQGCSARSAAFVALKGDPTPLDVSRVTTSTQQFLSFLLFGWGLNSDSDILSESMRWMGEPHFSVAGAYFLLKRHLYRGKLSLLLDDSGSVNNGISNNGGSNSRSLSSLPPLDQPLDHDAHNWKVIEDDFIMVWVGQTSHCSTSMHSSPGSTLSDGLFSVLVVRSNFSRWNMARLLLALDSSGGHFLHPMAEIYRVRAYRLEPLCSEGLYTLDGERIEYGPMQAMVLPTSENSLHVFTIPPPQTPMS